MSISKEKFKEMLKEKGLKVTNQRLLVLEVLADHRDRHMTAEDIYDLVKEDYPEIGLATIYRTVQLLLEMQLVDRINLDDGCLDPAKVTRSALQNATSVASTLLTTESVVANIKEETPAMPAGAGAGMGMM